jgi:hypothetical protein
MATQSAEAQIRARVDAFVGELSGLIREAALEAVQEALVRDAAGISTSRRKPGRPAKQGGRRSRAAFDAATVLAAIKADPGTRTEIIAKGLGTDSKALKPAIDELVATKQITRKGKARGTTLHPTGSSASAPVAKKKASRKKRRRKASSRK